MPEIRKLTAAEIADQQRDAVRIAPGIWRDRDGNIHWSIVELLAEFGLEDKPEHRAAVLQILQAMVEEAGVAEVIVQEPDDAEDHEGFLG